MGGSRERRQESLLRFHQFLLRVYEERKKNISQGPLTFETDVQGYLICEGCPNPLENFWNRSGMMFIMNQARPCEEAHELEEEQIGDPSTSRAFPKEDSSALALPLARARQLISFYTMSQNPNMVHLIINKSAPLPPLWVRCDRSDPKQTIWLGAEPLSIEDKLTGINLYTVACNVKSSSSNLSPMSNKTFSADLEDLKETHRMRHHSSDLTVKGFARYEFLEATSLESLSLEDTLIPLDRNIFADFTWNSVRKMLQVPPLTSSATLNVQMASGSPLSSVYELNREVQFLLSLAESLETGITNWPNPLGKKPVVELVQKLLKDLKDEVDGLKKPSNGDAESLQEDTSAVYGNMKKLFSRRGDLDFLEQLWCKIWKNVTSCEDLVKCFKLIMKSLQHGELKTWVHQESNSLLSKLIKQSYHGSTETGLLSGNTPFQILLEIGLDKMKRDYVSYFVGKEFAIRTHLDYFISASVDLQEQVHRVQKLHHMLEIVDNCVELLKLEHENLIFLTQSCISYYKENPLNEKRVFQLPVRTTFVKEFYQNANPRIWRVEISSGQGEKKVKTVWQLNTTPPAEHVNPSTVDGHLSSSRPNL
ncbi:protein zwilch homolog isoform X2 [Rhineura floridana]|uniref:protein zwilch homolog isoform X2 n=1 Tax=Rhineura floridana TaxID=261503 RepID=UPI002AC87EDF|nr:protein zwilch homolog isoform X2 [Rhineura floridana]